MHLLNDDATQAHTDQKQQTLQQHGQYHEQEVGSDGHLGKGTNRGGKATI